jgi:hypothetical protein
MVDAPNVQHITNSIPDGHKGQAQLRFQRVVQTHMQRTTNLTPDAPTAQQTNTNSRPDALIVVVYFYYTTSILLVHY